VADAKEYTDADRQVAEALSAVFSRPKMFVGWDCTFACLFAFMCGAFAWSPYPYLNQGVRQERARVWDDFVGWLRENQKTPAPEHPVYKLGEGVSSDESCARLKKYFGEWLDEVGIEVEGR
jgi:hypothetical protein